MRKIFIFILFLFVANFTFSQENRITKEKLETLKLLYKWNDKKILIVNFYLPKNKCHYNQYENLKNGSQWFDNNIYKTINLSNTKNIFVYSDKLAAKKMIDNNRFFEDFENYFLINFFNVNDNCYGVIAINSDGRYSYKIGEFSTEDVTLLLKNVN